MLQTTINNDRFKYYLELAQATLKQYEVASDAVLHELYVEKSYKKGDRYGLFNLRIRQSDQTYQQYIEQQLNTEFSMFKMYYRDGVFDWQVERLEKISDDLATAINNQLTSLSMDVADIKLLTSKSTHWLLK